MNINIAEQLKASGCCSHSGSKYFGEGCRSVDGCIQVWPQCKEEKVSKKTEGPVVTSSLMSLSQSAGAAIFKNCTHRIMLAGTGMSTAIAAEVKHLAMNIDGQIVTYENP
ncbi:MAG: hypothetical protein ACLQF0_04375 [Dissulfurispiraceae bacterium]